MPTLGFRFTIAALGPDIKILIFAFQGSNTREKRREE
jgi:hypothetical protein